MSKLQTENGLSENQYSSMPGADEEDDDEPVSTVFCSKPLSTQPLPLASKQQSRLASGDKSCTELSQLVEQDGQCEDSSVISPHGRMAPTLGTTDLKKIAATIDNIPCITSRSNIEQREMTKSASQSISKAPQSNRDYADHHAQVNGEQNRPRIPIAENLDLSVENEYSQIVHSQQTNELANIAYTTFHSAAVRSQGEASPSVSGQANLLQLGRVSGEQMAPQPGENTMTALNDKADDFTTKQQLVKLPRVYHIIKGQNQIRSSREDEKTLQEVMSEEGIVSKDAIITERDSTKERKQKGELNSVGIKSVPASTQVCMIVQTTTISGDDPIERTTHRKTIVKKPLCLATQKIPSYVMMPSQMRQKRMLRTMTSNQRKRKKQIGSKSTEPFDSEDRREDNIKGNLELINKILYQKSSNAVQAKQSSSYMPYVGAHMRASSCYLPLPNHNYQQHGKTSGYPMVQAKTSQYQIKNPTAHQQQLTYNSEIHKKRIFGQAEDERQKQLSINKMTVSQKMQQDYLKMARAQMTLAKESERYQMGSLRSMHNYTPGKNDTTFSSVHDLFMQTQAAGHDIETDSRSVSPATRRLPVQQLAMNSAFNNNTQKGEVSLQSSQFDQTRVLTSEARLADAIDGCECPNSQPDGKFKPEGSIELANSCNTQPAQSQMQQQQQQQKQLFHHKSYTVDNTNQARQKFSNHNEGCQTLEMRARQSSTSNGSPELPARILHVTNLNSEYGHQIEDQNVQQEGQSQLFKSNTLMAENQVKSQAGQIFQPSEQHKSQGTDVADVGQSVTMVGSPDDDMSATSIDLVIKQADNNENSMSSINAPRDATLQPLLSQDLVHVMAVPQQLFKLDDNDSVLEQHVNEMIEYKLPIEIGGGSPLLKLGALMAKKVLKDNEATHHSQSAIVINQEPVQDKNSSIHGEILSQKRGVSPSGYIKEQSTLLNESSSQQQHQMSLKVKTNCIGQRSIMEKQNVSEFRPAEQLSQERTPIHISMSGSSSQVTEHTHSVLQNQPFRSNVELSEASKEDTARKDKRKARNGRIEHQSKLLKERGKSANATTMVIDVRVNQDGGSKEYAMSQESSTEGQRACRIYMERNQVGQQLGMNAAKNTINGRYDAEKQMLLMDTTQELSAGKQYQTAITGGGIFRPTTQGSERVYLGTRTLKTPTLDNARSLPRGLPQTGQKQPQYFAGFTQNVQSTMMKDDFDFTNMMPSDGRYYLGNCLDVRSSTNSIQKYKNKQLLSNTRIPMIKTDASDQGKLQDCKKQQKNNKIFLLQFNDMQKKQRDAGKGMVVHGKNYRQSNAGGTRVIIPANIQQLQNRLRESRDQVCRTADGDKQVSYNTYINDSSQIQLSQQPRVGTMQQQEHWKNLETIGKKPTSVGKGSSNARIKYQLDQVSQVNQMSMTHTISAVNKWASAPETNLPQAEPNQHHSIQPSQQALISNPSRSTTATKNINIGRKKLSESKPQVALKQMLDQNFVLASYATAQRQSRCHSVENMLERKHSRLASMAPVTKITPAFLSASFTMHGKKRHDFALRPSSSKLNSAFRLNQTQESTRCSQRSDSKWSKTRYRGNKNRKNSCASEISQNRTMSTGVNTSVLVGHTTVLDHSQSKSVTNLEDSQAQQTYPQRLSNSYGQMMYSKPQEDEQQHLLNVLPGKRILSKAQPSVFTTILGTTVGGKEAGLGSLETLKQICSVTSSIVMEKNHSYYDNQ